jgi:hypothetical protein
LRVLGASPRFGKCARGRADGHRPLRRATSI